MKYLFFNYYELLDTIKGIDIDRGRHIVWLNAIFALGALLCVNVASFLIYFEIPAITKEQNTDIFMSLIIINLILYFLYGWRKRYKKIVDDCLKMKESLKTISALLTIVYTLASLYIFYVVRFA